MKANHYTKIALFIGSIALLGAGCLRASTPVEDVDFGSQEVMDADRSSLNDNAVLPEGEKVDLWGISKVSEKEIVYKPIEWFTYTMAIKEASKDGCTEGCSPNGFYWRHNNNSDKSFTFSLTNTSTIKVKLLCNKEECKPDTQESIYKTVSYDEYLAADAVCRKSFEDCPYYAIGTGEDFFKVTLADDGSVSELLEWYVP